MTCIVGFETEKGAWMAGDSAAASGWDIRKTAIQKVFRVGQYTIGYTSSFRMGQILQHEIEYPECIEPTEKFMVSIFVEAVRKALKEFGYTKIESNQESGGDFLVSVKGKLFRVESDFQVNHYIDGWYAIGCGADYALGAMYIVGKREKPDRILLSGLYAASEFSNGVSPPFTDIMFSENV